MGLFTRNRGKHESTPDSPTSESSVDRIGAEAQTAGYPRFDPGGRPIVEFSPQTRVALGLDGDRVGLAQVYREQAAVRLCVDFLADNIAHCKLKVYRRVAGGREEVPPDHPLRVLLEHPQGRVSGFEFMRDSVADKIIYGNAYWAKMKVNGAQALVRVQPPYVGWQGGHPAAGPTLYQVDVGGGPVYFKPERMVHFRQYNPEDIRVGVSVLESLQSILSEEKSMSRHRRGFWKNNSRHEGWIKRPKNSGHWSLTQRQEFRADWQAAMSGAENAGKVAILEDDMELHNGSFSPSDAQFLESRNWNLEMVATAMRIPLAVLSRGGTFTFASMKEFHITVYVDTLGPHMAELEKAINVQLVPDYNDPDLYVEFNIEEKLQGDFETQADALRKAIQVPYMSPNEGRRIRNLPPDPDPSYDHPAKLTTYVYAGDVTIERPTPPSVQGAIDQTAALEKELQEDLANGHH
jgi:HK97 family phage portal protein